MMMEESQEGGALMRTLAAERARRNSASPSRLGQTNYIKPNIHRRRTYSDHVMREDTKELDDIANGRGRNSTPDAAKLAEVDYKMNGRRCKSDFAGPRWIPDPEVSNCKICNIEFDMINRRHHCRYCGYIFCNKCCYTRLLLPKQFGLRDPQRICNNCVDTLQPLQVTFENDFANHLRTNTVDIVSECNVNRYFNLPFSFTLGSEIRKAAYSTYNLFTSSWILDKSIPLNLILHSKGLAYLTVAKGGCIFGGKFGTGLVIGKLPDGSWSPPSAIGIAGLSWGAFIGADITDYVIILNTDEAVRAFSGVGLVSIGADIEVAVGPVGRNTSANLNVGDGGIASAFSYSHSKGLYAGIALEGSVILSRSDVNHNFYGRSVNPMELIQGRIPRPKAAQPLYDALEQAVAHYPNPSYKSIKF